MTMNKNMHDLAKQWGPEVYAESNIGPDEVEAVLQQAADITPEPAMA